MSKREITIIILGFAWRALFITGALVACGCGASRWNARAAAFQLAAQASLAVDYRQTVDITGACMESNPVIGACGERMSPAAYFLAAGLLHVVIADRLPEPWRSGFQIATVGVQAHAIRRNWAAGFEP